jgi:hypothetical protein
MLPSYNADEPERLLNDPFTLRSAAAEYRAGMRTRTFVAILIGLAVVLAAGMSAHRHGHGGMMSRLAMAIHGGHGGNGH